MELFYTQRVIDGLAILDAEESAHCVRVLRHRTGDSISVIDGTGTLLRCEITEASAKEVCARVVSSEPGWGAHPYHLRMAVCPTKNIDRYEWFVEKATELGIDEIVPVIGDRSERRVLRTDRLRKIALSAAKQSLKAAVPAIAEPVSVCSFIESVRNAAAPDEIRLIAYCSDDVAARGSIMDSLARLIANEGNAGGGAHEITILIGPEGDFSQDEVRAAMDAGFVPVHLGPSRLRTETAALTAVEAVYLSFLDCRATAYESNG